MIKLKGPLHFGIIFLAVSMAIFLATPANAGKSEDAHLVKIVPEFKGDELKGFYINPQIINVKKGDIVIWMNGVEGHEVQITFEEGKACRDVTANPILKEPGFFLDANSCYITSFLPYSQTSMLQFMEKGTYHYIIVTENGKMSAKGKIIVGP